MEHGESLLHWYLWQEATTFYKRLADMMALKHGKPSWLGLAWLSPCHLTLSHYIMYTLLTCAPHSLAYAEGRMHVDVSTT